MTSGASCSSCTLEPTTWWTMASESGSLRPAFRADELLEVAAGDVLEHQEQRAVLDRAAVEAAHDVGVVEAAGDARLALEAARAL